MTVYVVIYSIITALLCAATVALCVLWARAQKRKLDKAARAAEQKLAGERAFAAVYGRDGASAVVLIDEQSGSPVYASDNVSRFLGVTAADLYSDITAAKKNIDKKYVREFDNAYSAWDKHGVLETDFDYGDGGSARAVARVCEHDGKRYILFVVYDKSDERRVIKEMQTALDAALEQAAAKSTFLSSMSHEIRTPMNGVMGMLSLARMNINDPEKATAYLDRAGDLSVFLLSMINDILDISKIESGKMQLFETTLDVTAFAEKIRNMFGSTMSGKGILFTVETIDIVERYLVADELRLTQVVTNLVSNAGKFTPSGGSITVTVKQLDRMSGRSQLMIRVRDTGKGIAPENIRKIMRPFEQEEASTAHNYGGTGLGLAICDNIVRMMGGNIVVDSTLGKGTDFSVFLSLAVADPADVAVEAEARPAPAPIVADDFTFDGCRILLAEDNEVNAEIAVEILESEGAVVTLAHDGREALDIFTESPENSFDLLLLDIQMPRMNGREAATAIRESGKKDAASVPMIALSADAFVEDVKLSEAAGMDGHVSKPIDFDELRKRSGEIIAVKKSRAE